MAQIVRSPTAIYIRKPYEELALVWHFVDGTAWRGARIDGEFEVAASPDDPTDWWISDVRLALDNGKTGRGEAAGRMVAIDQLGDRGFTDMVIGALSARYASAIAEWIDEAHAELRSQPIAA